jgi:hypothetical protein
MEAIQLKLLYEEKEFLKAIAAKNRMTMSQYVENLLNDEVRRLMMIDKSYAPDRYKYMVTVLLDEDTMEYTDLHKYMYTSKQFNSFSEYVRHLIKQDVKKRYKNSKKSK